MNEDPLVGSTLAGRYHIERRIGEGAMGAVYRATQTELARPVALKILRRDIAWAGDTIQRFRREAQAMSALQHPNTVRVYDFGATPEGLLFLAMELLEGEPASSRLMHGEPLGTRDAAVIAQEVLRSLAEAHTKGIVHRDVKPDNVFLANVPGRAGPMVKVLDFGIAKAIEGERKIDQFETLDGTVFGTPRYMSPEQAAGKPLDLRTDLYSVGVLLYELLAGQPPFVDADAVVVMAKHIREDIPPFAQTAPHRVIPRSLEAAVRRALQKDPSKRYQSAEEFDRALEACLPDVDRLEHQPLARVSHAVVTQVARTSTDQRVMFLVGLGVCLVLGGWWWWAASEQASPPPSTPVHVTVPAAAAPSHPAPEVPALAPEVDPRVPDAATPDAPTSRPTRKKRLRSSSATKPASPYEKF
jgi:eukaryotic-like serine/threonine-protein kinase